MAFIRIRSPSNAPPVFLLEGSTEITPIYLSGKSIRKRRTNSSTSEDFPAPPVPVIPKHRRFALCSQFPYTLHLGFRKFRIVFCSGNQSGNGTPVFFKQMPNFSIQFYSCRVITLNQQIIDHPLQPHVPPIIGMINACDTIVL